MEKEKSENMSDFQESKQIDLNSDAIKAEENPEMATKQKECESADAVFELQNQKTDGDLKEIMPENSTDKCSENEPIANNAEEDFSENEEIEKNPQDITKNENADIAVPSTEDDGDSVNSDSEVNTSLEHIENDRKSTNDEDDEDNLIEDNNTETPLPQDNSVTNEESDDSDILPPPAEDTVLPKGASETVFITDDMVNVFPESVDYIEKISDEKDDTEKNELNIPDDESDNNSNEKTSSDTKNQEKTVGNIEKEQKTRGIDTIFDIVELFIFSFAAVLIISTFFFRHSVVEGSSMESTLYDGEHIFISDFFYTPERGDIIVCEDYTTYLKKPIVKRVIAIEGDHLVIDVYGNVYVNGEQLHEDYIYLDGMDMHLSNIDMIIPEGEIFVMGDHRNMSTDSRDIGTVSVDSVLGKVLIRFYPFEKFGKVN